MKLEYDKDGYETECIAYIDKYGIIFKDVVSGTCICIYDDGSGIDDKCIWEPDKAIKKFYPGDKLTITF